MELGHAGVSTTSFALSDVYGGAWKYTASTTTPRFAVIQPATGLSIPPDKKSIAFDKNPANKQETLDMAVNLMCASGKINDTEAYRKQVYLREEESTTGIGEGIAIPHGKGAESKIKTGQ
jgi:hypothetical protein